MNRLVHLKNLARCSFTPAPINHHAQHDGGHQAEHRADRRRGAHVLLERRQQEEHRLQPFARHGEKTPSPPAPNPALYRR